LSEQSPTQTYPHVPIGEMLRKIRADNAGRGQKRVVVLGAGVAGLVAAYELQQLGHTVTILEGSARIGGRILTHHFKDGSYNELGAMRVPRSHDYTNHYIDAMGLSPRLIPFVNGVEQNFLDIHGVICRARDSRARVYPRFGLPETAPEPAGGYPQDPGGAIFGWVLANAIAPLTREEIDSLFKGEPTTDRLRALDSLSLGAFLDAALPPAVKQLVGAYTSLAVWFDKAVTMFIRDTIVGTSNYLMTLSGGMSQLPERLHARLAPGTVLLEHEVTRIALSGPATVTIGYRGPAGRETVQADYVLCTLPFGVLRRTTLEGFSYGKTLAISQMAYAASTKVILDCRTRFWQSKYGIYGGASISDGIQRQTYYPMDHLTVERGAVAAGALAGIHSGPAHSERVSPSAAANAEAPGALLGAYCWGADAERLGLLTPNERAEAVRRGVARFHPEILDDNVVVDAASIDWQTNRWSAGAFAFLLPGQLGSIFLDGRKSEGRVYFAGEHCSTDQAWIQGALIASLDAVDEIVSV
jgi:monoamine oxidase